MDLIDLFQIGIISSFNVSALPTNAHKKYGKVRKRCESDGEQIQLFAFRKLRSIYRMRFLHLNQSISTVLLQCISSSRWIMHILVVSSVSFITIAVIILSVFQLIDIVRNRSIIRDYGSIPERIRSSIEGDWESIGRDQMGDCQCTDNRCAVRLR